MLARRRTAGARAGQDDEEAEWQKLVDGERVGEN